MQGDVLGHFLIRSGYRMIEQACLPLHDSEGMTYRETLSQFGMS